MPIDIRRDQILQLADAAAERHRERSSTAQMLSAIFQPDFDAAAWLQVCEAAAKTGEWAGAHFNQGEAVNRFYPFGQVPGLYALIATDGSQILPNRHGAIQYYFIQTGSACIAYNLDAASEPVQQAAQQVLIESKRKLSVLEYDRAKLYTAEDELISPGVVANQRDVMEIELMAERCRQFAEAGVQPVAIADGSLVPFALLNPNFLRDRQNARKLCDRIVAALDVMRKAKAIVGGYIDRPDSNAVVRAARLAGKSAALITKQALKQLDEGSRPLFDRELLSAHVPAGQRTAWFDPGWMVNDAQWLGRGNHSMRACYINVGDDTGSRSIIGRLEMPAWCVQHAATLAAVIQRQTRLGGGYPFILKAAHEEAVVTREDQAALEKIIQFELRERGIRTDISLKQAAKDRR